MPAAPHTSTPYRRANMAPHPRPAPATPRRALALALLLALCALDAAPRAKAQMHNCELGKLSDHLKSVESHCCKGNDCSKTGFPTSKGTCSVECGKVLEPFWDSCGEVLQILKMMPHGMDKFYKKCLAVL